MRCGVTLMTRSCAAWNWPISPSSRAAACEFTGVGRVRFIAPDPSDDDDHADPDGIASSPDDGPASCGSGGARTPRAPGTRPAEGNRAFVTRYVIGPDVALTRLQASARPRKPGCDRGKTHRSP